VSEPGIIFRGFGVPFGEAQWEEIKEAEGTDRFAGLVLSYLTQGYFNTAGLGRHWTIDEEIAKNYSYNGRGWPVVVVADWDGRGEDRDTSFGGGQSVGQTWEHEQEVTLLPGTELRLIDIWWGPAMESIVPMGDRLVGLTIRAGKEAALDDEGRVSVAEEAMERAGHTGRTFSIPSATRADAEELGMESHELQRVYSAEAEEYVASVLGRTNIRVMPRHWDLRGGGQAITDGMNYIGLAGNSTHELTLLHEIAHIMDGTAEGDGHGLGFQQRVYQLYATHLGQAAADIFADIVWSGSRTSSRHGRVLIIQ